MQFEAFLQLAVFLIFIAYINGSNGNVTCSFLSTKQNWTLSATCSLWIENQQIHACTFYQWQRNQKRTDAKTLPGTFSSDSFWTHISGSWRKRKYCSLTIPLPEIDGTYTYGIQFNPLPEEYAGTVEIGKPMHSKSVLHSFVSYRSYMKSLHERQTSHPAAIGGGGLVLIIIIAIIIIIIVIIVVIVIMKKSRHSAESTKSTSEQGDNCIQNITHLERDKTENLEMTDIAQESCVYAVVNKLKTRQEMRANNYHVLDNGDEVPAVDNSQGDVYAQVNKMAKQSNGTSSLTSLSTQRTNSVTLSYPHVQQDKTTDDSLQGAELSADVQGNVLETDPCSEYANIDDLGDVSDSLNQ